MWKTESPFIAILVRLVGVVFNYDVYRNFIAFVLFCTVAVSAFGQTSVLTQHNDNARTGQNTSETILDTSNVNVNQFGKLFAMPADGQVYAQPLYVPGVTIKGGVHNVVIIATENDSVYAYDADSGGAPLWKASMVDAAYGAGAGETALNSATTTFCDDTQPLVGITSTPVIDAASKTIYVEAKSTKGMNYFHRLHALDLLTGNEKPPGPAVISATVSGTGDGSDSSGHIAFDDLRQLNRPGLLLLNGTIYIAYASHCDKGPYHGWLFAYDVATFAQKSVYVTTPNGGLGGFWMSGAGVAADASGNIFIASGNGDFDPTSVPVGTGDTILKLGTTNQSLTLLDYFTPEEQSTLKNNDLDLGSGGVLLLPDQPGSFPHILVEAGKEGRIYVVNRDQMTTNNSHYCSGCPNDPEIIEESGILAVGISNFGMFNIAAYWNNTLYFGGVGDALKSIPITNGVPDFTHVTGGGIVIDFPGTGLSVSSNGTVAGSAIVWGIDSSQFGTPGPAVLYAFDATNIPTMLYSSGQNAKRDAAGNAVKFAVPTIANGKVYVGTSTEVDVYGLVGANPAPKISSMTPSTATAEAAAFPLTVNGTGFISGATVNFGSSPAITPSSVTSSQIVVTIPAADIATAGTVNVTVTNPASGGTSNAQPFTINNPAPTATSLSPTSATAGGAAFTLTVDGTGFVSTSVVKFNGAAKTTTFVNATQLSAAITAADIATAGTAPVTVTNPAPGGGTSGSVSFTINAASSPALTSIAPATATVGGAGFTLNIIGTGFVVGATVNFGTNPTITPSSVTSTQIVATIPAADIATAGTVNVTVTNPTGGGTSNAQPFTINNPAPTATSLSPTSATAGGAAFTLTVNGTGFVSTSFVKFNGAAKTTTFVSATQLTAAITAADIATAGTATVTVTNPAPGGGTSGNLSFTISAVSSGPTLTSIAPATATVSGAAFTLTLTGTGFVAGTTVNFGSNPAITPSSVTSTQIVATIPATDIATAGTVNVTVTNPVGGGTSNAQTFTINNPAPIVTSLSPTSATAGGAAFTLTVNGMGFVSTSVVKFNGAAKTTTFVSATQLTAAIIAVDIATAGTATVTVTNPAPGGGTSGNLSFTISAVSGPTLTSIAPATATVSGAAFTLTLTGTGFVAGTTVNFGSNPAITPSSVTSTQIVATIPATDIATAGTVNVTVTNPVGGGTSNAQTFTINNPAPIVTSLSPTSATAGGAAFTLTVNGMGFVSTSVVKFNGAAKTTTFVSATQLTAAIIAVDIATAGTATVTVTNPAPGGGTSGNLSFTISAVSGPTLTSIAPATATVSGAAFTLTLTGTGFVTGAAVNFGSNPAITPSSVASTQIVATIPAADIATAGTVNVTVTNPATGGTSNAQSFTINNPAPIVTSLSPTSATAGGAAFTLTVNGTAFVSTSVVKFNGAAKTTTFVSATQLTAAITAADIATAGTATVTVTNPAPGGGTSGNLSFTISAVSGPTLTSIAPTSATAGGAAFTLTLTGAGFVAGATVNFGTNPPITPSSVTSTQIVATIPAADIATAGTVNVTVTNPAGGGTSNAQTFTINNPAPIVTSLSPTSATAGGAAFTLTVNGTGFVSTSVVKFNGAAKTTTFISTTQLTAAITAADIATAGTATVAVTNPSSGGTSNAASFTINNPAPTVSSLSPSTAVAGSAAFTLTLNGAGFVNGSSVQFNGTSRATTFVSTSHITAAILASDIATAGTANVTATNPVPTLGQSGPQVFTITSTNNPVPTIASLDATHIAGGTAFTLTVDGANFEAKSVVNFNGKPQATTFVNATKLSATIPASDVAIAGNMNITVTNPAPGGGTSAASPFTVDGYTIAGPSGASLSPSQPAIIQLTATPSANGFANPILFSVSGLPPGTAASFSPAMLTPNGNAAATILTITDGASAVSRRSANMHVPGTRLLRPLLLIWIAAFLAWFYLRYQVRAIRLTKHYTALELFTLIFLTGSILSGCALGVTSSPSTNTSQLTVTATSGTLSQQFRITLTVTR